MSKFIVVIVHRDRYYYPKLRITVEHRTTTLSAANAYIARWLMAAFARKTFRGPYPRIKAYDFRVVDELGLKRLKAAAKASATIRRKRGAKKAAATRARNRLARVSRSQADVSRPSYEIN